MKYIVNKEKTLSRILDGEAIIIQKETSYFYGLNKTGTLVWELLTANAMPLEIVVKNLAEQYDQQEKTITPDVKKFLASLVKGRLIKSGNVASGATSQSKVSRHKKTEKYNPPLLTKFEALNNMIVAAV
ncbi:MAG: PqqD family protein [Candidatus Pacebacteria bacterium]|nr:PqqD family protein [Candidatus Paceibacterota bacterium]MDD5357045.1 PqqD family protein [Candidatus Paceibacterota bacterium]